MTTPHSAVLIDVRERLARIETKLDHSAEWREEVRLETAKHRAEIASTLDGHDARLTVVEGRFKTLAAFGTALMFLLTFLQGWIVDKLP